MTDSGLTRTTAELSLKTVEEKQNPKAKSCSVSDFGIFLPSQVRQNITQLTMTAF